MEKRWTLNHESKSYFSVYLIAVINCTAAFLNGYTTAIISGAILYLSPYFNLENSQLLKGLLVRYQNIKEFSFKLKLLFFLIFVDLNQYFIVG